MRALHQSLLLAGLLACSTAGAQGYNRGDDHQGNRHGGTISRSEYRAQQDRIEDGNRSDKRACRNLRDNAEDVCKAEAEAKMKVALAELEYRRTGKALDRHKIAETRAKQNYEVAREKCDDAANRNAKANCLREARIQLRGAELDAKRDRLRG